MRHYLSRYVLSLIRWSDHWLVIGAFVGWMSAPANVGTAQEPQPLPFDLGIGNITIETGVVVPGLQTENTLTGVYFVYGQATNLTEIPIVVAFQLKDSAGNVLFTWTVSQLIPNDFPPFLNFEGRYEYPLPDNQLLPLDFYTLQVEIAIDETRVDLFPNGEIPVEDDPFNNANESIGTRILQLSGKVIFGDIVTELTSLDFFDPALDSYSGTVLWNSEITIPFINLTGTREEATLDLMITAGEVPFTPPANPYSPRPGALAIEFRNGTLGPQGAYADLFWKLPSGIGYRDTNTFKITYSEAPLPLGRQKLSQGIEPAGPIPIDKPMTWISDGLPLKLETQSVQFELDTGLRLVDPTVSYQFTPHMAYQPKMVVISNDSYFNGTLTVDGEVVIRSTGLSLNVQSANVNYISSFPVATVSGSQLVVRVRDGSIAPAESGFNSVHIEMPIDKTACTDVEPGPMRFAFDGGASIGRDGHVAIDNTLQNPLEPRFNTYTFLPVSDAVYYQPGYHLPNEPATGQGRNVSEYLQAMKDRESDDLYSFGDAAFSLGGDVFAGVNLFPDDFQGRPFETVIDKKVVSFTSTEWTKFYIRPGGYSGVVDALNQDFSIELYQDPSCGNKGYDVQISSFGQAYLDNKPEGLDSTTEGIVSIPWPSLIDIPFERMTINACGNLAGGKVPANVKNQEKTLAYWLARLRLMTIAFVKRKPAVEDSDRTLWISTKNPIEHVSEEATMQLNLKPCGTIADSRIEHPLLTRYDGYPAAFQHIYLSSFDGNPTQPNGFYNLIGDIHVSLFDPPKIHAIVNGFIGNVCDGSPWFGPKDPDANRDGFPDGFVSGNPTTLGKVQEYVAASPIDVRTRFADLITLKYKLAYNATTKEFRTQTPIKEDLIILDIDSSVEYLNTVRTEISFGVGIDARPRLNLASKFGSFSQEIQNTFLGPVRDKLEQAANGLRGDIAALARPAMEEGIRPLAAPFVGAIQDQLVQLPATFGAYEGYLQQVNGDFDQRLDQLMTQIDLHAFLTKIDNPAIRTIQDLKRLLDEIERLLNFSPDQLSPLLRALINHAVKSAESFGIDINALLAPVERTRDEILSVLQTKVRPALAKAEQVLDPRLLLDSVFPFNEIQAQLIPKIKQAIKTNLLNLIYNNTRQTLLVLRDKDIARMIVNEIFNSVQFQQLIIVATTNLLPVQDLMRDQAQQLIDSMNFVVDDFIKKQIGRLEGAVADFNDVQGFKGASLKGYAIVAGNTIEKLRIDGNFEISNPEEIDFQAYLDMTRYKVGYNGKNCTVPIGSGPVMDTRIGAKDIPLKISNSDIKVDIELSFMTGNNKLLNVGGTITARGSIKSGNLSLKDPRFRVSIGSGENFLVASVDEIRFSQGKLKGGIFIGTTSCLDPLMQVDKNEAPKLFAPGIFRGIYTYGEGSFPVLSYGCLLTVGAEGGVSFWVFADGPKIGGKIFAGIYGEAACVVTAKGRLSLLGAFDGADFVFQGSGWIAGGIGLCDEEDWKTPEDVLDDGFCLACVASFDLLYKNGWSSDYDVDCN